MMRFGNILRTRGYRFSRDVWSWLRPEFRVIHAGRKYPIPTFVTLSRSGTLLGNSWLLAPGNSDLKPIETINWNSVAQSEANLISTGLSK